MKYLVLLARVLYSLMFIVMGVTFHLSQDAVGYASSAGVPMANILVPLAGVMAAVGGISVAVGFKARWGAWLLVAFLVPVTGMMHQFWTIEDAMAAGMQQGMFFKNLSMLGCALFITQMGSGPCSIDSGK